MIDRDVKCSRIPGQAVRAICAVALLLLVSGCGGNEEPASAPALDSGGGTAVADPPSAPRSSSGGSSVGGTQAERESPLPSVIASGKVEFRVGEGVEVSSFKPSGSDAAKFYDQDHNELCKLTFSANKLKAKSADDKPLFELKSKDSKVMLKDASGENELFKFKIKGRNIDFYAPGDKRVYRLRAKDYGYALEDNSDNTLFRAKVKDGKIVLRDPADKTVLYSKDLKRPLSLVFFRMQELTPEQQAACSLYFLARPPR